MINNVIDDAEMWKKAIKERFGSLREYAKYKNTSVQNISNKLKTLSSMFLRELKDDGINLSAPHDNRIAIQSFDNNEIQSHEDSEMVNGNFNSKTIHLKSSDAYKELIQDMIKNQREDVIFMRRECLENQRKIIKLLEELIKRRK